MPSKPLLSNAQFQALMDFLWFYHFFEHYTETIERSQLYRILERIKVPKIEYSQVIRMLIDSEFFKMEEPEADAFELNTGEIFFAALVDIQNEPNLAKRTLKKIILFLERVIYKKSIGAEEEIESIISKDISNNAEALLEQYKWEYEIIHPVKMTDLEDLQTYAVPDPDWPEDTCKAGFCYRNARTVVLDFPENLYVEGYVIDWDGLYQHAWNKVHEFYYDVTAEAWFECITDTPLPLAREQGSCLWFALLEITKEDLEKLWDLTKGYSFNPFALGVKDWYYQFYVKEKKL